MFTVPTTEPTVQRAGETWHWTRTLDDFSPADGWSLIYYFAGAGKLSIVCTTSGNGFDVLASPQDTGGLVAGRYTWDAVVTLVATGEKHVADSGVLTVLPNLAVAVTGSAQTHSEKMLALVEAELERRLTGVTGGGAGAIESYVIHGRSVSKIPVEKLKALRGQYLAAVQRERNPGSIGIPIEVTFGPIQ